MNIKEAKEQIKYTVKAYLRKNQSGRYVYPLLRQRPILLMGPPGIGKTAIMEQAAEECEIGLVAYTITHHTRQSAIGLPVIKKREYGGQSFDITEYTMSEIIASVYECMERTGKKEGILFIDEINCVSETLAPTMLQFLQNKTFGTHRVPEGWIIVAAGNPSEYNKSVREFDVVTLDRVRRIDVQADLEVWLEYAWKHNVHGAVLSYLNMKKDRFYAVENTVEGKAFVTARGWEDLSEMLKGYESLGVEADDGLMQQFLQKEDTARDFAAYYRLYQKYGTDYEIPAILKKNITKEQYEQKVKMAGEGSFEERFIVTGLVLDTLNKVLDEYACCCRQVTVLHELLLHLKAFIKDKESPDCIGEFLDAQNRICEVKRTQQLISPEQEDALQYGLNAVEEYYLLIKENHIRSAQKSFEAIKQWFEKEVLKKRKMAENIKEQLEEGFRFIDDSFGAEQEMLLFVSNLTANENASAFLAEYGCPAYYSYSSQFLCRQKERKLQEMCREALL